jgi:superfamily II DNA or RNA helicase
MRVSVKLRNRRASLSWPFPDDLPAYFSYTVPNYRFMPAFKLGDWDGTRCLMEGSRVPTGLFLAMKDKIAEEAKIRWKIKDLRRFPEFYVVPNEAPGFKVRPYQNDAVEAMIAASNSGGILLNATGTGKTLIAGLYFRRLVGRAVFVVDELTLLEQAREELKAVIGEEVGIVGKSQFKPKRITVATIQTLRMHAETELFQAWAERLEVMIVDELHIMLNRRQEEVIALFRPKAVFGLTATLEIEKEDVKYKAFALCGPVIFQYGYSSGVSQGFLTPGVVVGADLKRSSSRIAEEEGEGLGHVRYMGSYHRDIVFSKTRNDFIADLARAGVERGYMVVVLVERVAHLEELASRLDDLPHDVVWGGRAVEERVKAKKKFEKEKIRLILANKVFKKGVNLKKISMMIDAASMKNKNDAVQKYGRGVRLADQKNGLLYFDIGERGRAKDNLFVKATRDRRAALAALGVPVESVRLRLGAEEVLNVAERLLARHAKFRT